MMVSEVDEHIAHYFHKFFHKSTIDAQMRLVDLGFESIDYIALATYLFKKTDKWLNIAKITVNTKISDLASCLINHKKEPGLHLKRVKLDPFQRYVYSYQLNNKDTKSFTYLIHFLHLKEPIDMAKMEQAIRDTLNNHFILNTKIIRLQDEYYFEQVEEQAEVFFKGSFLFPKRDIAKLKLSVHADRLVNIYLQKKKKDYYLIISFHHIALDGWSHKILQEEIFRRYAGLYNLEPKKVSEDIQHLAQLYSASINQESNTDELRAVFKSIEPTEYNRMSHWFLGTLEFAYNSFVLSKEEVEQYARNHHIQGASYSVIFTFMLHHMISQAFGVNKLFIYISLSNRFLPIADIATLAGNLVNGLPLFLDNTKTPPEQFAANIANTLRIYFKHMSYGATSRILLEGNTLLNNFISPYRQPFNFLLTYINNTSKLLYGSDAISSKYVNWSKSTVRICEDGKGIFWDVHHLGEDFLVHVHSRLKKGIYTPLLHNFLQLYFPDALLRT